MTFKATAAEAGAACIEINQKDLNSQPKAIKIIFDKVKKHCQDNNSICFIYIDGLDDATGQEILVSSILPKKQLNFSIVSGI